MTLHIKHAYAVLAVSLFACMLVVVKAGAHMQWGSTMLQIITTVAGDTILSLPARQGCACSSMLEVLVSVKMCRREKHAQPSQLQSHVQLHGAILCMTARSSYSDVSWTTLQ